MTAKIKELKTQINQIFNTFDKDGSGTIEKTELKAVCAELGIEMGNAEVSNMMEELDLDRNGVIDKEEF